MFHAHDLEDITKIHIHIILTLIFIHSICPQKLQLIDPGQALKELGLEEHNLRFTSTVTLEEEGPTSQTAERIYQVVKRCQIICF